MDIQSFVTTLGRYIRDGLLELPLQNDLPAPGLTALIGDLWQGRPLKMHLQSQEVQGQSLVIRGTLPGGSSPFAPAGDLAFSGSFYLLDGAPELTFSAALPDGYRLPDSFRALLSTSIQRAVFRDASLALDSAANRAGEDRRLIFRGALRIKNEPLFRPVGWMLGEPDSITLEGAIQFGVDPDGASVPLLSFTGLARQPFELGPFKLSAAVGITAKIFETTGSFRWYAGTVEILIYFGAVDFRLPLSMPLDVEGSPLKVLSLRGDSPRLSSFSQLSSIVDGPDYGGLLPAQIPLGSRLQLTRLDLTLAPALRQLSSIEIGVALDAEVEIIPDVLTLERTEIRFRFSNPRDLSHSSVRLGALLDIAGVGLETAVTLPGPILEAQLAPDDSIPVSSLLRRFFGEGALPDGANFDVVELLVTAKPRAQTYGFEGTILGELPLDLGLFTLTLESLILEADFGPQGASGRLACGFQLLGTRFEAAAEKPAPGEAWVFSAGLIPGSTISLSSAAETLLGLPSDALPELALEGVAFRIDSGSKAYALTARTAGFWEFQVTDDYLLRLAVDVRIERDAARKLSGELAGELFVNDFRVLTTYSFDPGVRRLQLEIQYQDLRLAAEISSEAKPTGGRRTVLRVDLGTLDLGAALRYLTDVAAPGLDITLDEPWDLLMNLQLTNTVLVIDLTDKSVGFETRVDKNFGFVSVDTIGLLYSKKAGKPAVDLRITGSFLGTRYPADKPLSWNVLDGKAPDVPGRGSGLLDIRYLGLGQRVALRSLDGIETVTQAIDRLREAVGPVDDSKPPLDQLELVRFDRDSHWLIGMEIVALSTVQLSIVFNDPYLYGLLLRLQGERAKALSGFSFEILYKKVTDDIGVFKTEVQVPDAFRRIEVGAATIVLPVIALEIYTNGNFKVDLGFPRNRDFSRSFSLQMGPFMGFGGLYFASLTGATSRRVPQIVNGEFHPVLEFGLGLAVGLGKEIRKGPLKAGLSITVEAMLEGALAWFHPYDAAVKSDQYHWIQGTLALVGRLYGEVDFVLISVSVEVIAYASATFTIESYEPIRIELSVGVTVRASIKILFVRIRFSFSIRLSESFTIGSKGTPPWIVGTRPRVLAASRKLAAVAALEVATAPLVAELLADAPPAFDWSPATLFAAQRTVELAALPAFTVAPGADGSPALQGVLLLTVESGDAAAGSSEKPFDTFVLLLLSWAIRARLGTLDGEVTRAQLDEIHDALQTPDVAAAGFHYENLAELLRLNVRIRLRGNDDAPDQPGSAAVFPMIPELSYQIGDGTPLSFRDHNPVDDDYSRRVTEYFKQLSVAFGEEPAAAQNRDALVSARRSVATVIFCDALLMLARSATQAAQDHFATLGAESLGITRLLADLIETGRSANLGGMLSRFLLHGLQIPSPDDAGFRAISTAEIRAAGRTEAALEPLYILTGQQFAAPAGALKITVDKSADADWIELVVPASVPAAEGEEAPPAPAGLVIALTAAEVAAESPATRIAVPFHGPEPLPLSQAAPVRSTLTRYLRWQDAERPGENPTVWLFPQDLLARIERGPAAGQPYELQAGSNAGGPVPQTSPVASFAWATALEVHIRRTTAASGSVLPDTYQVLGANQIGRELLRGLWTYLKQTPGSEGGTRLRFLYSAAAVDGDTTPGRLVSAELDEGGTFLLQTNLSTLTTSGVEFAFAARKMVRAAAAPRSGTYWASPAAPEKFIELLWEGSITGTGGYSLRYRTAAGEALPDTVFSDRGEAVLWLVVLLGNQGGDAPDRRLLPFHNAAVVGDDLDPAAINLFAQGVGGTGETTRIAAVAPGNVGFRLTRPAAEPGEAPSPAERAESLFSLLGFSLREAGPFLGSNEGVPAGPKPPDGTPDDELAPDWVYERVVPVARFARVHALPDCAFLPSREADPYAGIGADAAATLRFAFRDVFGNPADLETDLPDLPLRVGYTDDVIGLSGWPGVSGSYELEGSAGAPSLVLDLDFETAGYLPTAGADAATVLATAAAHAGRYRQIYYQVMQEDLAFRLRTSLAPETAAPVAKADLAGMVQAALVFLSGAALLRPVSHAAAGGATLGSVATDFSVGVGPLGRAQAGARVADLFADSLQVPVYHVVAHGDTLAAVAEDAGLTLEALTAQNPGAVEPLTPGASLLIRESFVFPGPADTLGGIAESAGITVEQLAAFNAGTALRDGALLAIPGLVELEDGGSALAAPSRVRPGECRGAVAARLGLDPLEFARLHADLDLLAGGVEVQVDGLRGTTRDGDSLNAVAGRLGVALAALAQAVAPAAGLLRSGAFVAGPAPAVDDQESQEALAARAGVTPGALARANVAVAGILRPGASLTLNGKTLTAGAHETWASLAERFRLEGIETSIEDLATAGKADRALLAAGARVLVPPAPVRLAVDLGASRNPAPIFEVAVELETARNAARVHPEMAGVEEVARQSTPLAPRSVPGANGALALQEFARRFEAALPDLKVAMGGRRTAGEDPRSARPIWAVRFGGSGADGFAGFALDGARPAFYALRPLANRPVSQSGVPVRPYASGTGLGDPVPVNLQGVDLEVWARSFLNALDLFLSPESAVAAFLSEAEHAAFEAVAGAKKTLADAIRLAVEPILEGDGDAAGLEAAREAVRQRLLIGLAPAYATDTLVQYRTTVASPFADPGTAPRLSGRPVSRVYRTGDAEGLASVAATFGVSPSHLARTLGSVGKILRPGLTVTLPGHGDQTVASTDSLAALAGRFGVAAGDLAGLSGESAGRLFAPGAVLPLTGLRRGAKPSDTFETLADFFGLSIATVAGAAQDTAGIFRAGAVLRVAGREPVTVAEGATLRQLAAAVGLSPADLAEELRSEPGLFGPDFEARAVTVIPDHTLSTAKTPLADGGSAVTFLLDVKAEAERRKVFLDLDYAVNELEHDIENVEGVEGYQASSWLSFLRPVTGGAAGPFSTSLGLAEIPLPLRSYPEPAALTGQSGEPTFETPADLREARQWTYGFRFQHQDAAQDTTFLRLVLDEDGTGPAEGPAEGAAGGSLFAALAEFAAAWPALERDLADLRKPGGESGETARIAVQTFADLARGVAAGWSEHWGPSLKRALRAVRSVRQVFEYRMTRTVRPGSDPAELETLVLTSLSGRPGPLGRFPEMSWIDAQGTAHRLVKESEEPEECIYRYAEAVPAFARVEHLCELPGLDVVPLQNGVGGLQITRNADLVSTGPTREVFVYRTPVAAFPSPIVPLLVRDATMPLRQGDEGLEASLRRLFGELAAAAEGTLPLVLQVTARYGYELVPGLAADPIVSLLPILYRPRFLYQDTFPAELAEAIETWAAHRNPNRQGGFYLFDVGVFSSLDESLPWPILDLRGLVYRLDVAGAEVRPLERTLSL